MNIMNVWYIFLLSPRKYPHPPTPPWGRLLRSPNYLPPRVFLENKTNIKY